MKYAFMLLHEMCICDCSDLYKHLNFQKWLKSKWTIIECFINNGVAKYSQDWCFSTKCSSLNSRICLYLPGQVWLESEILARRELQTHPVFAQNLFDQWISIVCMQGWQRLIFFYRFVAIIYNLHSRLLLHMFIKFTTKIIG